MTGNSAGMYGIRSPPPGREFITRARKGVLKFQSVGNVDVVIHGVTDQRMNLVDIS